MPHLTAGQLIAVSTVFIAAELGAIGWAGLKLAAHRATDVRIISYLFSLASASTCLGAIWAQNVGGVDSKGAFQGQLGSSINSFLKFMLDLDSDVKVFFTILALIVFPQFLSYLLAGLFGCASAPVLVGRALSFFVWSLVKAFVTVAGIILTVALYGYAHSWIGWNLGGLVGMSILSFMLLLVAFFILSTYREIGNDITDIDPSTEHMRAMRRVIGCVRAWLTRNVRNVRDQ